jgi:hypothetical protein
MDTESQLDLTNSRRTAGFESGDPSYPLQFNLPTPPRNHESGAVLAEACIGLALMVFFWILLTYSCYLGTNHIRTAMACRYVAWLKGQNPDGPNPTVENLERAFFFEAGLLKLEFAQGEGITDILSQGGDRYKLSAGNSPKGPFAARVTFGVTEDNREAMAKFPFSAMEVRLPFMAENASLGITAFSSECQWDSTGDTWTSPVDAIKGMFGFFYNELSNMKRLLDF